MKIKFSKLSMIKRTLALVMLMVFFVCVLFGRLLFVQVINRDFYIQKGLGQWLRDLPLTAQRGMICDRNGVVLASSYTSYDIYVRPADIKNIDDVVSNLANALEKDYDEILKKIDGKKLSEIVIAKDVDKSVVNKILSNFSSGIFFTTNTQRNYAYDNLLCQVLGFIGGDNQGKTGLELFYNSYLTGFDGVSLVESDLKGTTIESGIDYYKNPIDGLNLTLTIDFKIQNEVEKILKQAIDETGAKSVSCLIQNPKNGEIISICTLPSFDLNNVPTDDIELLNKLSRASTIVDTFEPGSTFKSIVAAIALQEKLTSEHGYFYCGGYRIINGVRIRCSRRSGHGSQSLEQGLMNSCNCVFMDLIEKIGIVKFYDYLDKLGISSGLGIDFPGETRAVLMEKNLVTAADLARMGFGQSIAISALEMVNSFSAVVNGGYVYSPYILKSINSSNKILYEKTKACKTQIFSKNVSETMRNLLYSVVSKGGGKYAKVEGYNIIGGKTGTAQKYKDGVIADGKYIASFIGFAPYYDPDYVVYVYVDEPQGAYYGGVVAAPIASKIFAKIFEIKNYTNSENDENVKHFALPSFIGKTLTEACSLASSLNLQYLIQGDGEFVTNQICAPETDAKEGDIVLLIFE